MLSNALPVPPEAHVANNTKYCEAFKTVSANVLERLNEQMSPITAPKQVVDFDSPALKASFVSAFPDAPDALLFLMNPLCAPTNTYNASASTSLPSTGLDIFPELSTMFTSESGFHL
jgi:hypothetical protein